jgi:hypothetical protein
MSSCGSYFNDFLEYSLLCVQSDSFMHYKISKIRTTRGNGQLALSVECKIYQYDVWKTLHFEAHMEINYGRSKESSMDTKTNR